MAQIGYPIPAESAVMCIRDKICTRLGSDDDMESNASTFTVEMRDINYVLVEATDQSLIIIDELGRGTSISCGLALGTAICEQLIQIKVKQPVNILSQRDPLTFLGGGVVCHTFRSVNILFANIPQC